MRRWNGWGDDATSMNLTAGARAMLAERLGPGLPGQDAQREDLLARIPPSRLPEHPLISREPSERFASWSHLTPPVSPVRPNEKRGTCNLPQCGQTICHSCRVPCCHALSVSSPSIEPVESSRIVRL